MLACWPVPHTDLCSDSLCRRGHFSWGWTCAEWPACVCVPVLRYGHVYLYRDGALFWLLHWEIWAFWSPLLKKINQGGTQLAFESWVPNWKFPAIILTILLLSKHFDISYDNEHSPQGRIEQDHQWEGATNNCAPCSSHNNLILSYWEAPVCLARIELLGIWFPFGQLSGSPLNSLKDFKWRIMLIIA